MKRVPMEHRLVWALALACVANAQPTAFDECTSDFQCADGEACRRGKCKVTCASQFPTDAACGPGFRINLEQRDYEVRLTRREVMADGHENCCQPLGEDLFIQEEGHNCQGSSPIATAEECEQAATELEARFGLQIEHWSMSWVRSLLGPRVYVDGQAHHAMFPMEGELLGGCQLLFTESERATITFNPVQTNIKPNVPFYRNVCRQRTCNDDDDDDNTNCPTNMFCVNSRCKACHDFTSEDSCPGQCQWEEKSFPFTGGGECTEKCGFYEDATSCPVGRCRFDVDECKDACGTLGRGACENENLCFWDGDECQEQIFVARMHAPPGIPEMSDTAPYGDCGFHLLQIDSSDACEAACYAHGQNMRFMDIDVDSVTLPHGCIINGLANACMYNGGDGLFSLSDWEAWDPSTSSISSVRNYFNPAEYDELYQFGDDFFQFYPLCKQKMCTCRNGHGAVGVEEGCFTNGDHVCHGCNQVHDGEKPYLLNPVLHTCERTDDWMVLATNRGCYFSYDQEDDDDFGTGLGAPKDLATCLNSVYLNEECQGEIVMTNAQRHTSNYRCECANARYTNCGATMDDRNNDGDEMQLFRRACHTFLSSDKCPSSYCEWRSRGEPYTTGEHYAEGCFEAENHLCPSDFPNCWHTGDCVNDDCKHGTCYWQLNQNWIWGNGYGRCNGDHGTCKTEDGASVMSFWNTHEDTDVHADYGIHLRFIDGYRPHDAGFACRFPFMFNGVMYNSCTDATFTGYDEWEHRNIYASKSEPVETRLWCAVGTDHRDWGYCDMDSSPTCSKPPRLSACSSNDHCPRETPFCVKGLCQKTGWVVAQSQAVCENMIEVYHDWRARVTLQQCMNMASGKAECGNFLVYGFEDKAGKIRDKGTEDVHSDVSGDDDLRYDGREALAEMYEEARKDANRKDEFILGTFQYGTTCGCVPYGESCIRRPLQWSYRFDYHSERDPYSRNKEFFDTYDDDTGNHYPHADDDVDSPLGIANINAHQLTILKQATCPDDHVAWFYKEPKKNCDWVGLEPASRCHVKGNMDGRRVYASIACPTTCGGCGQCLDDPNWRLRSDVPRQDRHPDDDIESVNKGCRWVGQKRARCNRYGRDGLGHRVSAREACCKACSKFFDVNRRLSADAMV